MTEEQIAAKFEEGKQEVIERFACEGVEIPEEVWSSIDRGGPSRKARKEFKVEHPKAAKAVQKVKDRMARRRYNKSPKGKATTRRYNKSPKGKVARRQYSKSSKGKVAMRRYRKSPKGKATVRRRTRERRCTDPAFRIKQRLRDVTHRVKPNLPFGTRTKQILGADHAEVCSWLRHTYCYAGEWSDLNNHLHHRIPLHKFNHLDPRAQMRAGYYRNLVALPAEVHREIDHNHIDEDLLAEMQREWLKAGLLDEGESWSGY